MVISILYFIVSDFVLSFIFHFLFILACLCGRYLLRRSALELFMVDRSNFFFDFGVHYEIHLTISQLFSHINISLTKLWIKYWFPVY